MVTNEEVYRRMNIKQSLLVDNVRRKMNWLGHVLRKEVMEHLVITGFVDGKLFVFQRRPRNENL